MGKCIKITKEQINELQSEWVIDKPDILGTRIWCKKCSFGVICNDAPKLNMIYHTRFCPKCGAPMTDKATEVLWDKLKEV